MSWKELEKYYEDVDLPYKLIVGDTPNHTYVEYNDVRIYRPKLLTTIYRNSLTFLYHDLKQLFFERVVADGYTFDQDGDLVSVTVNVQGERFIFREERKRRSVVIYGLDIFKNYQKIIDDLIEFTNFNYQRNRRSVKRCPGSIASTLSETDI